MPILTAERLIIALKKLSDFIANPDQEFQSLVAIAGNRNAWFTEEQVNNSLKGLRTMLNSADIETWFESIKIQEKPKRIGLILAGNIPVVGFHDVIAVLSTGNVALIKLSSSDDKLLPELLKRLISFEPILEERIIYVERLQDFDAVIATGSNNSSRYFEYYFGKVPNIIRKNRTSVGVITGNETPEQIVALGHDIFDYFGLGCRNVSKLYIPKGYDLKYFFEPLEQYQGIINHFKYNNNYDYNKSIYLVNNAKHYDNGFLLLKEDAGLSSPLAVLFFQYYETLDEVSELLKAEEQNLQCVVSATDLKIATPVLEFGESQKPRLWDYADNVNTIEFLNGM